MINNDYSVVWFNSLMKHRVYPWNVCDLWCVSRDNSALTEPWQKKNQIKRELYRGCLNEMQNKMRNICSCLFLVSTNYSIKNYSSFFGDALSAGNCDDIDRKEVKHTRKIIFNIFFSLSFLLLLSTHFFVSISIEVSLLRIDSFVSKQCIKCRFDS